MRFVFLLMFLFPVLIFGQNNSVNTSNKAQEFTQFYPNGKIKLKGKKIGRTLVDTLYTYYSNNDLQTFQVFHGNQYPRTVYYSENLRHMSAKRRDGTYLQTNDTTYIKEGICKYYYNNGQVMDSLIYKNGEPIYRIRLKKKK